MCGIAGVFRPGGYRGSALIDCVAAMTATLAHRGPDRGDTWVDPEGRICLGHRRLSILDLSAAGAQPMHSDCGRFSVTFNGEIYNHLDIRGELEVCGGAPRWIGSSDTETLLHAIRHWGIEGALKRFNGMFAFGLWDARDRTLTLCRDRFGEKPLFYGWIGQDFVFASELKAFSPHPKWHPTIDRRAMTAFMRYAYVPAPWTIWEGFRKLAPGSFITVASGAHAGEINSTPVLLVDARLCRERPAAKAERSGCGSGRTGATFVAGDQAPAAIRRAAGRVSVGWHQLIHDRGVDAATVFATRQDVLHRFRRSRLQRGGPCASRRAPSCDRSYRDDVSPSDARDVIPRLAEMSDEPFAEFIPNSDPAGCRAGPAQRDRLAVRRRRRRTFWRV